jgi:hypothetical protein
MAVTNDSSEANAVEEAYQGHVQNLFKVLVTNLIDAPVSHQTDQQSADRFATGLKFGKRARELALNIIQPPSSAMRVTRQKRGKSARAR